MNDGSRPVGSRRTVMILGATLLLTTVIVGAVAFALSKSADTGSSDELPQNCQLMRPSVSGEPSYAVTEFHSGKTFVESADDSDAAGVVAKLRRGQTRARILASGAFGGFVDDLDGDKAKELTVIVSLPSGGGQAILFSPGVGRIRGDANYAALSHLALVPDRDEEQIDNIRRVDDCDGDGRPDLVVETMEDDCDDFICIDTSSGVTRYRAYVISGKRAGKSGTVTLASDEAPRAQTIEEPY
jgi:hypothetical protein